MDQTTTTGCSLLEAFSAFLLEPHLTILAASIKLMPTGDWRRTENDEHYKKVLWRELSQRLRQGTLVAYGFQAGAYVPTRIDPAFFNNAVPDYLLDAVSSHGASYGGVRITKAGLTLAQLAEVKASIGKTTALFTENTLGAWFILRVRTWPEGAAYPSEAEDLRDAEVYFGEGNVPRAMFRQVRRTRTHADWRKPGPRKPKG